MKIISNVSARVKIANKFRPHQQRLLFFFFVRVISERQWNSLPTFFCGYVQNAECYY